LATLGAGAALALVAAVVVAPKIGGGSLENRFGGSAATATPEGGANASISAFRNEEGQFQFSYPSNWTFNTFASNGVGVALEPSETTAHGRFTVEVTMIVGSTYDDPSPLGTRLPPLEPRTAQYEKVAPGLSGAPTVRWEEVTRHRDGINSRRIVYRIDWTGRRPAWAGSADVPVTLQFMIGAPTDEFWQTYGPAAVEIVNSVIETKDVVPLRWQDVGVFTPWGRIVPGILYDESTSVLIQFLDARAGKGDAKRLYDGGALQEVSSYVVDKRQSGEGGMVEFTVRIEHGIDEVITADSKSFKIRDVQLRR